MKACYGIALSALGLLLGCSAVADPGNTMNPVGAAGTNTGGGSGAGIAGNGSVIPGAGGSAPITPMGGGAGGVSAGAGGAGGGAPMNGGSGGMIPVNNGGSGGMAPMGGSGGMNNVAGSGTGGGGNVNPDHTGPSAGCGRMEPLDEPARQYVQHDMTVDVAPAYQPDYTTREYHTWLPENYDPNRAYPLYFWGNGCGVSQGNPEGIPVANIEEVRTGAILVFMIQEDGCFDAGKGGQADTPDIPYFTQMLQEVEDQYCVDRDKVFVGGYSSTAWYAATLSCSHGDKISGIAMAAGGQQDELPPCVGSTALILWAGNEGPGGNPIETPPDVEWEGSGAVVERLKAAAGCSDTTTKWDERWPSCDVYDNCGKRPVVFCPHGGGHDTGGGGVNSEGFWKLFKSTW